MLHAHDLHKSYLMGRTTLKVLRGVSLKVERGEFVVIRGASGSGKSTLLHLLGALDIPDRGSVVFDGQGLFQLDDAARRSYRNRKTGFVFQFYHLLPECNVLENVLVPRMITHTAWRWYASRRQARRDALEILERVGLADRVRHRPAELSGGERQRVAIARALINRPALLLADEPTGNLDARMGGKVLELLADLNQAGQTVIMVTHDDMVAAHASRRVELTEGVIRGAGQAGRETTARGAVRHVAKEVTP
ncbi:MAG: ABC transporter ATP-binding protein [Phycisphaerae bacterium]